MSNEMNEALKLVRELDTKCEGIRKDLDGLDRAKFEKANAALDSLEVKNQELTQKFLQEKNSREELESKLNSIEADLKRGLSGEAKEAKTKELKAFEQFLNNGNLKMQYSEERKFLQENNNEAGGYLAPSEYVNEIIKGIIEVSPVRQVARVYTTTKKEIKIPRRTGLVTGGFINEGQQGTESSSTYGEVIIAAHRLFTYTDISVELLRDSAYNVRGEASSDISEAFAQIEGAKFINGSGVSEPQGLLSNATVAEINTGNATGILGDSLYAIQAEVKSGYNGAFMLNRRTLHNHIRTLKDGQGRYLLQESLRDGLPNTIAGAPYFVANDMPDVAAGTIPIVYGDFRRGYAIVDNVNIEFLEDPYTQAISGKRRFVVFKRTGGGVILPEALKKLKVSV